ncbi:BtrH N-terminal domain-containing protein [Tengunoibacter tsumagoiensis]|uniref:Butirosin biosynthesis protein H N-terminal domain-containing protein n=1 Tax=Tengunoibacter tsumagoiensis TaxID=2014871 RepID=A0A402A698_9CHLR|nr:BtrH N-terminal domain-containing protein [Tengunoibacter tsumagoiensis]GCE14663.1 hypothetical protein KTT_45220 [Tengunoibacter tsumagoiensis]
MNPSQIVYVGNAHYCYANSAAMLLAASGETVSPALIEVLTGVGLGALLIPGAPPLFSMHAPDEGLSQALTLLGYDFIEQTAPPEDPIASLRSQLQQGPVVLGPLDMGHLRYLHDYEYLGGVDHYVLAYELNEQDIHLHDPQGCPYISLDLESFQQAWLAEQISYRRSPYRLWHGPVRQRVVPQEELYSQAISAFQRIYRKAENFTVQRHWLTGATAIHAFAEQLQGAGVRASLISFSLPLGAKRAHDYAAFFKPYHPELARLKSAQSQSFGHLHSLVAQNRWPQSVSELNVLADLEAEFQDCLLQV